MLLIFCEMMKFIFSLFEYFLDLKLKFLIIKDFLMLNIYLWVALRGYAWMVQILYRQILIFAKFFWNLIVLQRDLRISIDLNSTWRWAQNIFQTKHFKKSPVFFLCNIFFKHFDLLVSELEISIFQINFAILIYFLFSLQ